jgi:hypothetical protein
LQLSDVARGAVDGALSVDSPGAPHVAESGEAQSALPRDAPIVEDGCDDVELEQAIGAPTIAIVAASRVVLWKNAMNSVAVRSSLQQ